MCNKLQTFIVALITSKLFHLSNTKSNHTTTLHLTSSVKSRRRLCSGSTLTLLVSTSRWTTLGDWAFPLASVRTWNALQVNSALHPSGVAKSSTSFGWGKGRKVTYAGWQVMWSHMACDFPQWCGNFNYELLYPCLLYFTLLYLSELLNHTLCSGDRLKRCCSRYLSMMTKHDCVSCNCNCCCDCICMWHLLFVQWSCSIFVIASL